MSGDEMRDRIDRLQDQGYTPGDLAAATVKLQLLTHLERERQRRAGQDVWINLAVYVGLPALLITGLWMLWP